MRPMLLSSVVDVQGAAALRSPRVRAARQATGAHGCGQQGGAVAELGPGEGLEGAGAVGGAAQQAPACSGTASNSSGAKGTSTSRVPLPIGMSVSRGRSSTGMVMRSGRGRRAVLPVPVGDHQGGGDHELVVDGVRGALGPVRDGQSATSMPLPGGGLGRRRAPRGRAGPSWRARRRRPGASGASARGAGGAAGELSWPPYSSAAVARTRRQAGPSRAVWLMVRKRTAAVRRRAGLDRDAPPAGSAARRTAAGRPCSGPVPGVASARPGSGGGKATDLHVRVRGQLPLVAAPVPGAPRLPHQDARDGGAGPR